MPTSSTTDTIAIPRSEGMGAFPEASGRVSRIRAPRRRRRSAADRPDWFDEIDARVRALAGIVSLPEGKSDADFVREAVTAKYNSLT